MSSYNEAIINHVVYFLSRHGESLLAKEVKNLLEFAKEEKGGKETDKAYQVCPISDNTLNGLIRLIFPPNPEWTEVEKGRHFNLLRIALQLNPSELDRCVREVMVKHDNAIKSMQIAAEGNTRQYGVL